MDISGATSVTVEAQRRVAFGQVALIRQLWDAPIDIAGAAGDQHHLQLSLLPTASNAMGSFTRSWGPHRFERMGDVFLLPAHEPLHARSECRHQQSVVCRFTPEAAAQWFHPGLEWTSRRLADCLDIASPRIRKLLFQIGEELRSPGFASDAMIDLMTAQLAIEVSRHFLGIGDSPATGGLAPWRLRLIDDALAHDPASVTLGGLASLCTLSVRHLTRAFRISRGRSIGDYIAERRVNQARQLLADGLSVKEAAFATGFTAPSNFAAAFRRATGETPRQYRQRAVGPGKPH